jgi:hypothetical protein
MTRPLSPEREREFQELMGFLSFYATLVSGVTQTSTFSIETVCSGIIEQHGKSKALEGLRQAANDVIEQLSDKRADGVDLPPSSRTSLKLVKSVNHQENDGHEEEQIQRGTDHRVP